MKPNKEIVAKWKKSSGLSDEKCSLCKGKVTNAQLKFSEAVFGKVLCWNCQSLQSYA